MTFSAEYLQRLVKRCPFYTMGTPQWFAWMAEQMAAVKEVEGKVKEVVASIRKANERHAQVIAELESQLTKLRQLCPHDRTTYHPDPSGNSDSHTECDVCGASV